MKHAYRFILPAHIIGVAGAVMAAGKGWSLWWFWLATFLFWCALGIGIEVGVHRLFSHRAFKTRRWIEVLLAFLGTIAGQGSNMFWVAVHKGYHHPRADTPDDPHSPQAHGLWHAYFGWLLDDTQNRISYRSTVHLMRDPVQKFLHEHYYVVILVWCVILFATHPALLYAYLLASCLTMHVNFLVNILCHGLNSGGERPYETPDQSCNLKWLSIPSWGLSMHNNHHHDPGCYTLSCDRSEVDLGAAIIRLIATERREPRSDIRDANDRQPDFGVGSTSIGERAA